MRYLIPSLIIGLSLTSGMAKEVQHQVELETPILKHTSIPMSHYNGTDLDPPLTQQSTQKKCNPNTKFYVLATGAVITATVTLYLIHRYTTCHKDTVSNAHQIDARDALIDMINLDQWYQENCWAYIKDPAPQGERGIQVTASWCENLRKICECPAIKDYFTVPILNIKEAHCNPEKVLELMNTPYRSSNETYFEVFRHHAQELYGKQTPIPSVEYFAKNVYEFIETACNSSMTWIYRPVTANLSGSTLGITHYDNKSDIFTNPLCLKPQCVKTYLSTDLPCKQESLFSNASTLTTTLQYWLTFVLVYVTVNLFGR